MSLDAFESSRTQRTLTGTTQLLMALHIDGPLFIALCMVGAVGSIVLFSASGSSLGMLEAHLMRFALGLVAMVMLAQVPPRIIRNAAPVAYLIGLILLIAVMLVGDITMGAQRWLDLGVVRFQPSEIMKLAVPLACAWFLHERPLPPSFVSLLVLAVGIAVPTLLIAEQPDLGTSLLVAAGGGMVVLLAGLQLRYILAVVGLLVPVAFGAWHFLLHEYQKQRVLTFPIRRAIRWVRAITSSSRRSRLARAACSARAISTAARRSWSSCPSAPPTSSSPWSARNGA